MCNTDTILLLFILISYTSQINILMDYSKKLLKRYNSNTKEEYIYFIDTICILLILYIYYIKYKYCIFRIYSIHISIYNIYIM